MAHDLQRKWQRMFDPALCAKMMQISRLSECEHLKYQSKSEYIVTLIANIDSGIMSLCKNCVHILLCRYHNIVFSPQHKQLGPFG